MEASEFARRREALKRILGTGSMALIPAAPTATRNRDVEYPYRQDSHFYYLTGFAEPEALAVIIPGREQGEYILFCREKDPEQESWHGKRAGLEGACDMYGADDAFPITDIDDIVPGLMEHCKRIFYAMGCHPNFDQQVLDWLNYLRNQVRKGVNVPQEIVTLDHVISEMRLLKSTAEIEAIRRAADITMRAHERAMQYARHGVWEYQVEAEMYHEFMLGGARAPSYPAIVGGGENACTLHYTDNASQLKNGDLVLIDAGAEYDFYAADITRTFPVNGVFSEAQRQIYELVLAAQTAAFAEIYPGNPWIAPQQAAVRTITAGLLELGLLHGKLDVLIEEEGYKRFYMHRCGHWLGMDVHDVGEYKVDDAWRPFVAGMTLTVEPGIYIPAADDVDPRWWNIGVRIEDDILVTTNGHEVLTAALLKRVDEIEAFMAQSNQ
jgi:Xaa-Pro aminopeptidase